ncbi:MAG: hypothetical protein ACI9MR_002220 [Myxococcota bacterium]|jgi:hypothetical protein
MIGDASNCEFDDATNIIGEDPLRIGLTENGGDWSTIGPEAGSPARGLSDCLDGDAAAVTDDQRGFGRPATLCTARAYELYLPFNILATTTVTAAEDTYTSGAISWSWGKTPTRIAPSTITRSESARQSATAWTEATAQTAPPPWSTCPWRTPARPKAAEDSSLLTGAGVIE